MRVITNVLCNQAYCKRCGMRYCEKKRFFHVSLAGSRNELILHD